MATYYEAPEGMRTLLTLPDSEWNLNIYAQREGRTYSVIVGVGVGGSIVKQGLSRKAALAYVASYSLNGKV